MEVNLLKNKALQELRNYPVNFVEFKKITDRLSKEKEAAEKAKTVQAKAQAQPQAEGSVSSRTRNNNPIRRKSVSFAPDVAASGPSSNNGADRPADLVNDADDEFQSDKGDDDSKDTLALIRKFKLTEKRFFDLWSLNMTHMKKFPFDEKEDRLSDRMNDRLITAGGLTWNKDSRYFRRDWSGIATAAALEALFIDTYRPALLNSKNCPGAYNLRNALFDLLAKNSNRVMKETDDGRPFFESEWSFADGVANVLADDDEDLQLQSPTAVDDPDDAMQGVTADGGADSARRVTASQSISAAASAGNRQPSKSKRPSYNPSDMNLALTTARAGAETPMPRATGKSKNAPVKRPKASVKTTLTDLSFTELIEMLEKHPLLASSHPKARSGTIETLAHDCITILFEVRFPYFLSARAASLFFTPPS